MVSIKDLFIFAIFGFLFTVQVARAATVTISSFDDAYVDIRSPTTTFNSNTLIMGSAYYGNATNQIQRFYVKINISDHMTIGSDIQGAGIKMWQWAGSKTPFKTRIYEVYDDNWNEATLTWANQPCGVVDTFGVNCNSTEITHFDRGGAYTGWLYADITSTANTEIKSDGILSLIFLGIPEWAPAVGNGYRYFYSSVGVLPMEVNINYTAATTTTTTTTIPVSVPTGCAVCNIENIDSRMELGSIPAAWVCGMLNIMFCTPPLFIFILFGVVAIGIFRYRR